MEVALPAHNKRIVLDALSLSLGAAVALGFARFNYALLLPAMRDSLGWTYAQAGSMNTANALGYLIGALVVAPIAGRAGLARTFWVALLATGLTLLASSLTADFSVLLLLRLCAGLGGAATFISGATLASHLASGGNSGLVLGLYFGGVGIGIFLASLGLPQLLDRDTGFWRQAWLAMGVLSLLATWLAARVALNIRLPAPTSNTSRSLILSRKLLPTLCAYFLFGAGYITYMTFVIAYLRSGGVAAGALSVFWLFLGTSTFASAFIWGQLINRSRGGQALALVLGAVACGAGLPLLSVSLVSVLLSALLFGSSFLSVVSAITNLIRRALPPQTWAAGIALFTVFFSVGQTLGPYVSGMLADQTNSLRGGFLLSVVLLVAAALLALMQQDVSAHSSV